MPDKQKPMPAVPMKYDENGNPEWKEMWGSFCDLAIEGGPSHRSEENKILFPNKIKDYEKYENVKSELVRGLKLLNAKNAKINDKGEVWIDLFFKNKADWFSYVINKENVSSRSEGKYLILPCSDDFILEKEIKSVLTVWGKANHYWRTLRNWVMKFLIIGFRYDAYSGKF